MVSWRDTVKIKRLYQEFKQSSLIAKLIIVTVIVIWVVIFTTISVYNSEQPGRTLNPLPDQSLPSITSEPISGIANANQAPFDYQVNHYLR
jgi:hypothetical protein